MPAESSGPETESPWTEGPALSHDRQDEGGKPAPIPDAIDLITTSWPLRLAIRGLELRPFTLALLGFAGYWLLPLLFSAASGTLLPPDLATHELGGIGLDWLGRWLSRAPGVTTPYLTDLVHLGMAVVTPLLGGTIATYAIVQYRPVLQALLDRRLLGASSHEIDAAFLAARRALRHPAIRVMLGVVATLLSGFMALRAMDPAFIGWWGHRSHGIAGFVFAGAVWVMVFFGGLYLYFLAVGVAAISRLLRYPVHVQPLHPDECNGFGDFGEYLTLLGGLALCMAGALWVTFWGGYLGVEQFVTTWAGGIFCVVLMPFIVIIPLVRLTIQIGKARDRRTAPAIDALHHGLEELEAGFREGAAPPKALARELRDLARTHRAINSLYPGNTFPFKPKIAGTLSAGYLVQVVFFIRRALENFAP